MVSILKSVKKHLRPAKNWMKLSVNAMGNRHQCYVCRKTFHHFHPFRGGSRVIPPFVGELDVIGSDMDNFYCPYCSSTDRERHLFMYFDRLRLWDVVAGGAVLHVAPETKLRAAIARLKPKQYVQADLFPSDEEIQRIDVTALPFPDEYFDFIICNHVLEHVQKHDRAMSELSRVLKRGKHAVLQVPMSSVLAKSFQDDNINTDELRLRFYGQEDHVRVYGSDLFLRLQDAGFEVMLEKHQVLLPDLDSKFYGVNARENLVLVKRRMNGILK